MPAPLIGQYFKTKTKGWAVRWPEDGRKRWKSGFRNPTEARSWFNDTKRPQLQLHGPSPEITFDDFCDLFLERHTGSQRTQGTLREWLKPARTMFGSWPLRDLEGAAGDIARWRAALPTESAQFRHTRALRECLAAALRWRYITRNPAVEAGRNPEPRSEELRPFTRAEIGALAEVMGPVYGPLVVFAAESGLRTNEWAAVERKDIDRAERAVVVQRRVSDGVVTPYPKTGRRRVPLTARADEALAALPRRLDTPLLFPAPGGGYLGLDNWRTREWYGALKTAGINKRGPYHLRHTFATEALASGLSIFQLARVMGASVKTIDKHYGHLAHDSADSIRALLDARGQRSDADRTLGSDRDA